MAQLPGGEWLVQNVGYPDPEISVFHRYTEAEIVRVTPVDPKSFEPAMKVLSETDRLTPEQRLFAAFWLGYFYRSYV